jgi:predicted amidohydrolase YtcJ
MNTARRSHGTAWAACLVAIVSIAAGAAETPTLVLYNGTVIPMTAEGASCSAIAVTGDSILALGTDEEILRLAGPATAIINLAGRAVLPGFIDGHAHLLRDGGRAGLSVPEAQKLALSYGVTSAAEMVVEPGDVERYVAMAQAGQILVRTHLFLAYNGLCGNVYGPWYKAYSPFVEIAPRLSIGGVKLFVERSSCGDEKPEISFSDLLRPLLLPAGIVWYGDDRPLFSEDRLAAILREAADASFPVAMHAIGDAAVETALSALRQAGGRAQALRPLVLHNLFVRDDLLPLYDEVGATPVVEPVNACFADAYEDMLPSEYATVVRRWGDLAASAAHLAAGSDWPWGDPGSLSPIFRLANLVSPTNESPGYASWEPCAPLSSHQVASVWRALRMMTLDAAYELHVEGTLGSLEPRKLADLVVLDANPLTTPVALLAQLRVEMTLLDGKVEWPSAPEAPSN